MKNRIAELRKKAKLSQAELGKILNLSQKAISRYENHSAEPDLNTIKKIANYFNVTIDYLLQIPEEELILISKEYFQKLKEASEIIQKIDKTYNNSNYFSTGDIQIGNNNNNIAIGNNTNIKDSFNKK